MDGQEDLSALTKPAGWCINATPSRTVSKDAPPLKAGSQLASMTSLAALASMGAPLTVWRGNDTGSVLPKPKLVPTDPKDGIT